MTVIHNSNPLLRSDAYGTKNQYRYLCHLLDWGGYSVDEDGRQFMQVGVLHDGGWGLNSTH